MVERPRPSDYYFSPESELWKINRERAIPIFGGQRAILMQLANPLVAQAISEYSNFKENPLGNLIHTRIIFSKLIFGTNEEVSDAARTINNAHKSVKGDLRQNSGIYNAGTKYDAKNPELLMWVWATLADTSLVVYDKFVRHLADDEKEQFYQESKGILPLLGGRPQDTPSSVKDFSNYMKEMVNDGKVAVGEVAKELAPYIMLKQFPNIKPYSLFMSQIAIGLLPKNLRDQYGFSWNPLQQTFLDTTAASSRLLYPHILPERVRFFARYRNARKKIISTK